MDKQSISLLKGFMEKAKSKLAAARTLLKSKDYDDAVSRAYYAAFHAVQALLLTEDLSSSSHQGMINLFGLHFVKTGKFDKKFGRFLSNLKDDRESGDYEIYSFIDREVANNAVNEAKELITAIKKYLRRYLTSS